MSKYDCNNIIDYGHEHRRLCDLHPLSCSTNGECPLLGLCCNSLGQITQKEIDILQKWSDEHPEPPKLTKKERTFLECFEGFLDKREIQKIGVAMYCYDESASYLQSDMFTFLKSGDSMTFEELLKLEVEGE